MFRVSSYKALGALVLSFLAGTVIGSLSYYGFSLLPS